MKTQFVLAALEQEVWQGKEWNNNALAQYSSRGSQHPSIKHAERLTEAEIDLPIRVVGGTYHNALAERVIGLVRTEIINQIDARSRAGNAETDRLV
jgi:transposase InsO family protein